MFSLWQTAKSQLRSARCCEKGFIQFSIASKPSRDLDWRPCSWSCRRTCIMNEHSHTGVAVRLYVKCLSAADIDFFNMRRRQRVQKLFCCLAQNSCSCAISGASIISWPSRACASQNTAIHWPAYTQTINGLGVYGCKCVTHALFSRCFSTLQENLSMQVVDWEGVILILNWKMAMSLLIHKTYADSKLE